MAELRTDCSDIRPRQEIAIVVLKSRREDWFPVGTTVICEVAIRMDEGLQLWVSENQFVGRPYLFPHRPEIGDGLWDLVSDQYEPLAIVAVSA